MQVRLSEFSPTRQHVIITLTDNISVDGFVEEIGFSIKDVNPENKAGLPKYEVLLLSTYLSSKIEEKQHVNIQLFEENMSNLFGYLRTKKKGDNKINLVIKTQPVVTLSYATSLNLLSASEQENFNLMVFAENIEELSIYNDVLNAISKVKEIKQEFPDSFKATCEKLVSTGLVSKPVEKIIERTFGFKESLEGKRVFIIDTHNFYYRNYFGMTPLSSSKGEPTSVIKALTTFLKKLHNDTRPDYIVFASEGKNGIRFKMYDQYKANRDETPADLVSQIQICNQMLETIGCKIVSEEGFEADDVIGAYAKLFSEKNADVTIFTTDKDMYQLLSNKVRIYDPLKEKFIGLGECNDKFQVNPEHVVYALALSGDTSDNVPGVKGVGPKKGGPLIQKYGSIEGIYANLHEIPGKLKENLAENKENAFLSYQLVKLYDFIAEDKNVKDFEYPNYDIFFCLKEYLSRFEINV